MALQNPQPDKWGKLSIDGYPIPKRCPLCQSRRTVLTYYKSGDDTYEVRTPTVECEACCNVLYEYDPLIEQRLSEAG